MVDSKIEAEKKFEDFSEWYNDILERADLIDKRYPVKGMNIWKPYGWKLMSLIDKETRRLMNDTDHQEVKFPLLIPEEEFQKEADHIKGFGEEVYWVTHAGKRRLDIPLLLRPTSETAMYPVFDLWIRSHADLPLKIFQMVNVFRYETKQTRAFMRMREIHFFEAHTCHATEGEAERQIYQDLEIMDEIARMLCIPYLKLKRTDWDKFPGADYTVGGDALLPTGRLLQIAGIHQYLTNFSEAYDITYEDLDGEHKNVHQTTYGMSERLIGALIAIHGDDVGPVIPPYIAPIQVRIIPIQYGEDRKIVDHCKTLLDKLIKADIRADIDDREDVRPGSKFYESEEKGIPVRLDIGSNELEDDIITIVRRDTGEKKTVSTKDAIKELKLIFETMQSEMYERAEEFLKNNIVDASDISEISEEKVYRIGWCGTFECGEGIEESTDRSILGTLYDGEEYSSKCLWCEEETDTVAYLCKTH